MRDAGREEGPPRRETRDGRKGAVRRVVKGPVQGKGGTRTDKTIETRQGKEMKSRKMVLETREEFQWEEESQLSSGLVDLWTCGLVYGVQCL